MEVRRFAVRVCTLLTVVVDGAIHRAAGEGLYDECVFLDGAETGESKITGGHNLPAKHVIVRLPIGSYSGLTTAQHTVGPIYSRQSQAGSERLLRACYRTSLALAVSNGCRSIVRRWIVTLLLTARRRSRASRRECMATPSTLRLASR